MSTSTRFKKGEGGRPKGAVNKLTKTVKEVVLDTFNKLQSDKQHNLLKFAQDNPTEFYKIAAKLIPTDIKAEVKTVENEGIKVIMGKKTA